MKDKPKNKKRDAEAYRDKREESEEKVSMSERLRRSEVATKAASENQLNIGAVMDRAMTHAVRQYAKKQRERARNKSRRASRKSNRGEKA